MDEEIGSLLLREVNGDDGANRTRRASALHLLAATGAAPEELEAWCAQGRLYALCDLAADPEEWPVGAAMTRACGGQPGTAEICALGVATERRGQGLGRRLLTEVADALLRRGVHRVVAPRVEVTADQAGALEEAGFCLGADGSYAREL